MNELTGGHHGPHFRDGLGRRPCQPEDEEQAVGWLLMAKMGLHPAAWFCEESLALVEVPLLMATVTGKFCCHLSDHWQLQRKAWYPAASLWLSGNRLVPSNSPLLAGGNRLLGDAETGLTWIPLFREQLPSRFGRNGTVGPLLRAKLALSPLLAYHAGRQLQFVHRTLVASARLGTVCPRPLSPADDAARCCVVVCVKLQGQKRGLNSSELLASRKELLCSSTHEKGPNAPRAGLQFPGRRHASAVRLGASGWPARPQ